MILWLGGHQWHARGVIFDIVCAGITTTILLQQMYTVSHARPLVDSVDSEVKDGAHVNNAIQPPMSMPSLKRPDLEPVLPGKCPMDRYRAVACPLGASALATVFTSSVRIIMGCKLTQDTPMDSIANLRPYLRGK